jgi:hypothetical protein
LTWRQKGVMKAHFRIRWPGFGIATVTKASRVMVE